MQDDAIKCGRAAPRDGEMDAFGDRGFAMHSGGLPPGYEPIPKQIAKPLQNRNLQIWQYLRAHSLPQHDAHAEHVERLSSSKLVASQSARGRLLGAQEAGGIGRESVWRSFVRLAFMLVFCLLVDKTATDGIFGMDK